MRWRRAAVAVLGLCVSASGCEEREGPGTSSDGRGGARPGPGSSVGPTGQGGAAHGSGQESAPSQSAASQGGAGVTVAGTSTGAGGELGLGGGGAGGGPRDPDLLPPVLLAIFGSSGVGEGQFDHPHGLAMDRGGGLLYAGDQENNRVQVMTTDGRFVRQWSDPQFQHIHDVGIDPLTGAIYVGDYESDIVQKFTDAGDFILELGGTGTAPGQFAGVWGLSTDSTGRLYAADAGNQRVQVFAAEGSFVDAWTGFDKPTGVFVDVLDRVYVCDATRDLIVILDADGARLATWDLAAIVGAPSEPEDIVITEDGDHIYLGDVLNHRVIHLSRPR